MNKFFKKGESEVICSLLSSNDADNVKLGMNLIATHPRFKSLKKYLVVRNKVTYIRGYYNISIKQNFELFYKLHQSFVNKSDIPINTMFYRYIIKFIKKHTFKSK